MVAKSFNCVVIAAVAVALLLTGCGRKGRLDPPPDAPVVPQAQAPLSDEQRHDLLTNTPEDDRPAVPGVPKRRMPMDVLLN